MKRKIFTIAVLTVILTVVLCAIPAASANSAQMSWSGVSGTGALVVGEDCPVRVNGEKLVFDIPHFPERNYFGKDGLAEYGAKVSATYEFENPADYDVTVRLAFPFGVLPDYVDRACDVSSDYAVTADGKVVEKKVRYTFTKSNWSGDFDAKKSVALLEDEKTSAGWADGNCTVVLYEYKFSDAKNNVISAFVESSNNGKSDFFGDFTYYSSSSSRRMYGREITNGTVFSFYLIFSGEEPEFSLHAEVGSKEISCNIEKVGETRMTLEEYAEKTYPFENDGSESSHTDWFNLVANAVYAGEYGVNGLFGQNTVRFLEDNVLYWYEYELTVPAGAKVTNTVTAPLFPSRNDGYEPSVFTYDYLLSPAKAWASFGTLDVEVNMPYYLLDAEKLGFEKTENGYKAHFDSLPDGELSFRASESAQPEKRNPYAAMTLLIVLIVLILALGVAGIVVIIVLASTGAQRKNFRETDPERKRRNTLEAGATGFISSVAYALALSLPPVAVSTQSLDSGGIIALAASFVLIAAAVFALSVKLLFVKEEPRDRKNEDEEQCGEGREEEK